MILKPKWSKFQNPWNSSPKLRFFDLGRSIVWIETENHMALHKHTKIDLLSLCIDEGLWIVVTLSIVVFFTISQLFSKEVHFFKILRFSMYFYNVFAVQWSSKVLVLPFSIRSSYYHLHNEMLLLSIGIIFPLNYTCLYNLLHNHNENPTSSQECILFRIHLTKS